MQCWWLGYAGRCMLPVTAGQFRDNVNGIKYVHTPINLLHTTFVMIYAFIQQTASCAAFFPFEGLVSTSSSVAFDSKIPCNHVDTLGCL